MKTQKEKTIDSAEGRYIYGILDSSEELSLGEIGIGEKRGEVYTCNFKDISALISPSPVTKYPVSRENIMTHQKVLESVMREHTVLPVRFCTIAEEEAQIKKVLEKRYNEFVDLLMKMKNLTELGIKALWNNLSEIFKEIAEENYEIKKLKGSLEKPSLLKSKAYSLKVNLGERVKKALDVKKENEARLLIKKLKPFARDFKKNPTHGDSMFLNAAFLVDKEAEEKIDKVVSQLSAGLNGRVKVKYVGPVPVFNFIEIVIHWE